VERNHCILKEHQNQKQNAWSGNVPLNLQQLPGVPLLTPRDITVLQAMTSAVSSQTP